MAAAALVADRRWCLTGTPIQVKSIMETIVNQKRIFIFIVDECNYLLGVPSLSLKLPSTFFFANQMRNLLFLFSQHVCQYVNFAVVLNPMVIFMQ